MIKDNEYYISNLWRIRKEARVSYPKMAKKICCAYSTLYWWMNGTDRKINPSHKKLLDVFFEEYDAARKAGIESFLEFFEEEA